MATVSRHSNAPFVDDEVLTGTDLEADFNTLYVDYNGNITNANVAASANISGSKLANNSLVNGKMAASTLTVASMTAAAVPKHYVDIVTSGMFVKSQVSLIDWVGLTAAVLTPGSTDDMIFMDLSVSYDAAGNPVEATNVTLGWNVDGTDYDSVVVQEVVPGNNDSFLHSSYAIVAPAATSMTIKPRYRYAGTKVVNHNRLVFRCFILPGKA